MSFVQYLDHGALRAPDAPCLQMGDVELTYKEVQAWSHKIGNKLRSLGLGRGDHACVLATNDLMAFVCVFGFSRAGVTWVPANPRLSAEDIQYQINFFECKVVIFQQAFAEILDRLRLELPGVNEFVCLDADLAETPSMERWLGGGSGDDLRIAFEPDDLAMIMPTGGTTGRSKGVMLPNRALDAFVSLYLYCFGYMPGTRPVNLAAAPLTHAAGIFSLATMVRGGRVVILPKAEPSLIVDAIERERATELFLPPTVIYRILDLPGIENRNFTSLEYFVYAAAPMSVEKLRQALRVFGPVMAQCFGQAEAPALCTYLSPRDHLAPDGSPAGEEILSSCGYPTPLMDVRILDDDNVETAGEDRGEICVRGPLVMQGYYKRPDITAQTIIDGWLHTGDIGFKDRAGRIHISDRKKDMIISGGFNIYPQEIEQVLWAHPAVQDCAVIGVPDPDWGEAVKAVVELNRDISAGEEELLTWCKARLGSMRSPKSIDFIDQLPRSPNGKVLKRDVRAPYWVGQDRKI